MNPPSAKLLRFLDLVLWTWGQSPAHPPTPGTVTSADQTGVSIFWADSIEAPTHYAFHERDSWQHIEQYKPERSYHPIPYNGTLKTKRKKAKK